MSTPGPIRAVRLSAAQRAYLLEADYLPADLRHIVAESAAITASGRMAMDLEPEVAERFRSAFTERLAEVGLGLEYELTEEGVRLEELIDAFFDVPEP